MSEKMQRPLLSICIPTYNRSELLESALASLIPQIRDANGLVELVILDNCSNDNTPVAVENARMHIPLVYHRNLSNMGPIWNVLHIVKDFAHGEFCWIVGDDDIVRQNGVAKLLDVLKSYSSIDYVFLNHSYELTSKRASRIVTGEDFPEMGDLLCWNTATVLLERGEDAIQYANKANLFTSIVSHVFRREKWNEFFYDVEPTEPLFGSLEYTFPHVSILSRIIVGKPIVYLGEPVVILFHGHQEWFSYWPMIGFVRILEISDLFEKLGARKEFITLYRNLVFSRSQEYFWKLLTVKDLPGREYFSLRMMVKRYWVFPMFWGMIYWLLKQFFPKISLRYSLHRLKRHFLLFLGQNY